MITSTHNPLIKQFRSLDRMRERKKTGYTTLEGARTLRHAFENDWQIEHVFYVVDMLKPHEFSLIEELRRSGIHVEEIGRALMEKLSQRKGPLGMVAIIKWEERFTLNTLLLSENPLLLIAESIEKPGNLGVLIRSASAAGADAVVLCNSLTTFHEPSCIHSSLGSVFTLPCITTTTGVCLEWLKYKGIIPVVTTPQGEISYTDNDFTKPTAIIMGNEHGGVSKEFMEGGKTVKIIMHGAMDSLNVSVSAALFLFEAVRQRSELLKEQPVF